MSLYGAGVSQGTSRIAGRRGSDESGSSGEGAGGISGTAPDEETSYAFALWYRHYGVEALAGWLAGVNPAAGGLWKYLGSWTVEKWWTYAADKAGYPNETWAAVKAAYPDTTYKDFDFWDAVGW